MYYCSYTTLLVFVHTRIMRNEKNFNIEEIDEAMRYKSIPWPYYIFQRRTTPWENFDKFNFKLNDIDKLYNLNTRGRIRHLVARVKHNSGPIFIEIKSRCLYDKPYLCLSGFMFLTQDWEIFEKLTFPQFESLTKLCYGTIIKHNIRVQDKLPTKLLDEYNVFNKFYQTKMMYEKPLAIYGILNTAENCFFLTWEKRKYA